MAKNKDKDVEKANQAWRKQPRKFAPKSRLGCKTCKIRRVKCDLARPSCVKCQSTGRTCDGYQNEPSLSYHHEKGCNASQPGSVYQPQKQPAGHLSPVVQDLGPLMILPTTGSAQREAMYFFEYISIKNLTEYQPSKSWRDTLMFFAQTVPSVRYAALALALMQRKHSGYFSSDAVEYAQASNDTLADGPSLFYYNRAIQTLVMLNQQGGDNIQATGIALLVCYLFNCYDNLTGNYKQALQHLRGGVEMSRAMDKAVLASCHKHDSHEVSGIQGLIIQATRQIRRLDMQAVLFLVDWTPADIQEAECGLVQPIGEAFCSLDQSADHLHLLIARIMGLYNAVQQILSTGTLPILDLATKYTILGQLETWSRCFENMLSLQQEVLLQARSGTDPLVSLLHLQYTMAWTLINSYGSGREMEFDHFLPQFQQCVALAREIAVSHERYLGSREPTFTPEIGILPVLYIIGVKCRDPFVRREALSILRRQPMKEAVWDSITAARVVERVIEIEETGFGDGIQIPVWKRIETMSWIQSNSERSVMRMDIEYTFCARGGTHTETLVV